MYKKLTSILTINISFSLNN